jgi:hypothetical protein
MIRKTGAVLAFALLVFMSPAIRLLARQAQTPRSARESARIDLTGYWVSLVTEEWMYRSVTPPKGDYAAVPLNAEGRKIADTWDPGRDIAAGDQCKPFGAPGLMRLPLRVHISWLDDNTLKVETDAGRQTRLFHFAATPPAAAGLSLQGHSVAQWYRGQGPPVASGGGGRARMTVPQTGSVHGSLEVVTRNLRPGYLRKNGVPYGDKTVLTEYYDRVSAFANDYMVITTVVDDPAYLTVPFITTSHFKKEPDGSKWDPTPCQVDAPLRRPRGGTP